MLSAEILLPPVASLLLGYLLGSIPFGILFTRLAGASDPRTIGSGSIGATNVLRTGNRVVAAATLLADLGKGAAAVLIANALFPDGGPLAAIGAVFGHLYPVWLRFRGGKGVATLLGVLLALHWPSAVMFALVWIAVLLLTRISSVGGMLAAISAPVTAGFAGRFNFVFLFLGLALLVLWRHRGNIERLLAGTEPRVGSSR